MSQRPDIPIALVFVWALLLLLLAGVGPGTAIAEEDAADEAAEETETSPLESVEDKKAKALAAEIKKISKKKNATEVLPVLEKIENLQHKEFEKPLLKLLKHPSSLVSLKVAAMWEWRNHKKVAKKVWAATFGDRKVNKKRYQVKAIVLKSWPRAGLTLNDKQFDEVERSWRWIIGNPNPTLAPALAAMADYVRIAKDKRLCRRLAEELDEPMATNVNSGSNPPADWWERRWKMWKEAKPAVVEALKALTGQEFDKTAEAKKWFEANEKTFGFKW
ncbi:MAG: hypothetical protein QNJ90_01640 [Planctomycetota bacterium]|nr:hypothetical protein [Planctomycetota bacterium]